MKLKFFVVSIILILLILISAVFTRYHLIRSVSNYQECDNSPRKQVIMIGKRVCITLDGRKFEFVPQMVTNRPNLDIIGVGMPQVPKIYKNKYLFYADTVLHSPKIIYTLVKNVANQLADYLLNTYYNIFYWKLK